MTSSGCFSAVKKQRLNNSCERASQNGHNGTSASNGVGHRHQYHQTSSAMTLVTKGDHHSSTKDDYQSSTNGDHHLPTNGSSCCAKTVPVHLRISPAGANDTPNKVVSHDMVVFCFDALHCFLRGDRLPKAPKFSDEQFPLFVTWKMGKDKRLRGCIGTFNHTSLHNGLREYAITSACKDSRFDPITSDEVNKLHCSVSLLMDFEVAAHYSDWQIGIHGIRIEFCTEKGSKKAATYLPEVAVEQGWTHVQTIDSLLRKGGFRGAISADVRASVCVVRFQSDKLTVSYQEYLAHKRDGATLGAGDAERSSKTGTSSRLYGPGVHRYQTRSTDKS